MEHTSHDARVCDRCRNGAYSTGSAERKVGSNALEKLITAQPTPLSHGIEAVREAAFASSTPADQKVSGRKWSAETASAISTPIVAPLEKGGRPFLHRRRHERTARLLDDS